MGGRNNLQLQEYSDFLKQKFPSSAVMKVYLHYDESSPEFTLKHEVDPEAEISWIDLCTEFSNCYAEKNPTGVPMRPTHLKISDQNGRAVKTDKAVNKVLKEGMDLFFSPSSDAVLEPHSAPAPVEEEAKSKYDESKKKGENSYYYGHRDQKDEFEKVKMEEIRFRGVRKLTKDEEAMVVPITQHQFIDDDSEIQIRFKRDTLGVDVDKGSLTCDFRDRSFDLRITSAESKKIYRFHVDKLSKEIDKTKCKVRVKPERVSIVLKKKETGPWHDLRKVYGIGDTEKIVSDYGENFTVTY